MKPNTTTFSNPEAQATTTAGLQLVGIELHTFLEQQLHIIRRQS